MSQSLFLLLLSSLSLTQSTTLECGPGYGVLSGACSLCPAQRFSGGGKGPCLACPGSLVSLAGATQCACAAGSESDGVGVPPWPQFRNPRIIDDEALDSWEAMNLSTLVAGGFGKTCDQACNAISLYCVMPRINPLFHVSLLAGLVKALTGLTCHWIHQMTFENAMWGTRVTREQNGLMYCISSPTPAAVEPLCDRSAPEMNMICACVRKNNAPVPRQIICRSCSRGKYQPAQGGVLCVDCPTGSTSSVGSQSISNCSTCVAGYHRQNDECIACPAGKYQDAEGANSCLTCARGNYSDSAHAACARCPGQMSSPPGATSVGMCACAEGSESKELGTICSLCLENEYQPVMGGRCRVCPVRSTSPRGSIYLANCTCPPEASAIAISEDMFRCEIVCLPGSYKVNPGDYACKHCLNNSSTHTPRQCTCNPGYTEKMSPYVSVKDYFPLGDDIMTFATPEKIALQTCQEICTQSGDSCKFFFEMVDFFYICLYGIEGNVPASLLVHEGNQAVVHLKLAAPGTSDLFAAYPWTRYSPIKPATLPICEACPQNYSKQAAGNGVCEKCEVGKHTLQSSATRCFTILCLE